MHTQLIPGADNPQGSSGHSMSCLFFSECICDPYGTDPNGGECDRETGQCPCLPNVIGQKCDACAAGFWNITSQMGCSSCGCDPTGSTGIECNQVNNYCKFRNYCLHL